MSRANFAANASKNRSAPSKKQNTPSANARMDLDDPSLKASAAPSDVNNSSDVSNFMTTDRFSSLSISPLLIQAIETKMGYETMTRVQSSSLSIILSGRDCMAKAKTGTGKTLAFLIPAVERMLLREASGPSKSQRQQSGGISTLVLSPTRELANQIAQEAITLLSLIPGKRVVTLVGGTNRKADVRELNAGNIAVLVATPGRLQDHLENTSGISDRLSRLHTLVLDEADNLLEMGFKPAIDSILSHLPPKEQRQTLLFSATVPPSVRQVAASSLKSDAEFVDTVGEDAAAQTHLHVEQRCLVAGMEDLPAAVLAVLAQQMRGTGTYKIIVFFTTARVTAYMAALFRRMRVSDRTISDGLSKVMEIHSRKSQAQRTKTSALFRDSSRSILFSSDVSARGMDYPDVTFVLQVGLTEREQYVHRLGRTARAGKGGSGVLILHDFEEKHMLQREIKDMPLEVVSGDSVGLDEGARQVAARAVSECAADSDGRRCAEQAYQAWLGFYNSNLKNLKIDKVKLVEMANKYALSMGLREPPALLAKTVGKMNLKGVPGLNIDKGPSKRK
eukprot:CAMPEP_0185040834 /NCGR_PEP_ID=MMETSP1103-20130426/39385_1 /TAXON_ID=36769 /ORGANISM="Paraphysomonas bandaiensis, Strain Caron Lab Isolate" /LENGTH=561 /DNA_ID=CAMNT_0027580293 /DNA_START=212 /DNA_END=1897 /DNA_ORIENTATION=+